LSLTTFAQWTNVAGVRSESEVRHFWLMGEYAARVNEWGSNTVGWIAREANCLKTWESEQLINHLF
jgi:hypothetical protein